MLDLRIFVGLFSVSLAVLGAGSVSGQTYPNKPIRLLTQPAGGGVDFAARQIAIGLTTGLAQQVIVDNRAPVIARETAAKAPPDGYTLLFDSSGMWIEPFLHDVYWDPVRDFSPIASAVRSPNILVVHPSLPVKSVKELITFAKAKPGELNFASSGNGATNHLAGELFKAMAGINIVHIPFRGVQFGVTNLISGQVQLMFGTGGTVGAHVRSGRMRALAVTTPQKSVVFPDLPTMAEFLPGYSAPIILGILAPAKTPEAIIKRLNEEVVRVLNTPDVKAKLLRTGAETVGSSSEEFAAEIKADLARWGKLIRDARIRVN